MRVLINERGSENVYMWRVMKIGVTYSSDIALILDGVIQYSLILLFGDHMNCLIY